ncbi:MAG: hypothetical protein ACKOZY_00080, partial [Flavobacteriales bacterium]
ELTKSAGDLYERLVILRHKAYEENSPRLEVRQVSEHTEPQATQEEATIGEISFSMDATKVENSAQVSLIDAIEEVVKEQEVSTDLPINQTASATLFENLNAGQEVESVNMRLGREQMVQETVAKKLSSQPIEDLKRAITLNQRFQFSRELFQGSSQEYEIAIDQLNNGSREQAMSYLDGLSTKYAWDTESAIASDFIDLVTRRHI